jgi:hypothetical protein
MSTKSDASAVHFDTSKDMVDTETRLARGVKISTLGPMSALYTGNPAVKGAVDTVVGDTTALKAAQDADNNAQAVASKARTALALAMSTWDGSYRILTSTGTKVCKTPDDGTSLGLVVRTTTKNPLAPPIAIVLKQDKVKNLLRIHVQRAPGMDTVDVQMSPDPITASSWATLDSNGAVHVVPNPPKGTTWIRAASRTAKGKSDWTTPVSIVIV